jgi:hypothetical protein
LQQACRSLHHSPLDAPDPLVAGRERWQHGDGTRPCRAGAVRYLRHGVICDDCMGQHRHASSAHAGTAGTKANTKASWHSCRRGRLVSARIGWHGDWCTSSRRGLVCVVEKRVCLHLSHVTHACAPRGTITKHDESHWDAWEIPRGKGPKATPTSMMVHTTLFQLRRIDQEGSGKAALAILSASPLLLQQCPSRQPSGTALLHDSRCHPLRQTSHQLLSGRFLGVPSSERMIDVRKARSVCQRGWCR